MEPKVDLTLAQLTNGLTLDHDHFLTERPKDPEMRESTSVWLFEEGGNFGFPRIGIEAEAHSWDNHLSSANFVLDDGRVLVLNERGRVPSPLDSEGKATIFGAGPLRFQCNEPFRKWRMVYDGTAHDGTIGEQISGTLLSKQRRTPVHLEVELSMATPAWIQDYTPEKIAKMTKLEIDDARSMGLGWRFEQLCRGDGELRIDGTTRSFKLVGSRIKRQSVRPLDTFRGHCWQSALFPDGSAFGFIAYPANDTAPQFNIGYVYIGGKMYPARATKIPFIRQIMHNILASTCLSTFQIFPSGMGTLGGLGFILQQSGANYAWNGMTSVGMIERSATTRQMDEGYPE